MDQRRALAFIFCTVTLDVLAFGLMVPVLPRIILDWRQLSKLKGTYTDNLIAAVSERTGRVQAPAGAGARTGSGLASPDGRLARADRWIRA